MGASPEEVVVVVLWRVHVELEDRPGRLGELATAVGAAGCNIISLHVVGEPADDGSVTDELLVKVPDPIDPTALVDAVERAGIPCTLLVRADATELSDPATTALALAGWWPPTPAALPGAVATMLRARLVDPAGPSTPPATSTPCGWAPSSCGLGRAWPFTATELSRAAALLELAAQLAMSAPTRVAANDRILLLRDGSEVRMRARRPVGRSSRRGAARAVLARVPALRFLSPTPRLASGQLDELLHGETGTGQAVMAVTADGGSAVVWPTSTSTATASPGSPCWWENAWHGRGLGTALLRRVADLATEQGITELTGVARPDDLGITKLLRRAGLRPSAEIVDGEVRLRASLPAPVGS